MGIIDWQKFGLKQNPFKIIPEKDSKNLVWAGLKKIKSRFDSLIRDSLGSDDTKVVLNMSHYGGGKTHASFYYSNPKHFPGVSFDYPPPLHIFIVTPKEGNIAPQEFYTKAVESIGISKIFESIKTMRKYSQGEGKSLRIIQEWCGSEDIGRILWLLGDQNPDISYDASEFIFSPKPTATLKKKLKVRRGIESTHDKSIVISSIFKILSLYGEETQLERPRRIFLWLDEIESLIYYSTRHYTIFSQALRELIDMTPRHLTFFMNFSYADVETISTLEFIIGKALKDRITEKIDFGELTDKEALVYIEELLRFFRIDNFELENNFYPFAERALRSLFKNLLEKLKEPLMPRTINKWCINAIEECSRKECLEADKIIDENFIGQISFFEKAMDQL